MEFGVVYASDPACLEHEEQTVIINTIEDIINLSKENHNHNILIDFYMKELTIVDDYLD